MTKRRLFLLFWLGCWICSGCGSPVIPPYFRRQISPDLSLSRLRANPLAFIGRKVLLGGIIFNIQNYPLKTELKILEKPLGRGDIPLKTGYSSGRFMAIYDGYLDRSIYAAGRLITVAGEFVGVKKEDHWAYVYPVVRIKFFRLWPSQEPYYYPFRFQEEEGKSPPFWK